MKKEFQEVADRINGCESEEFLQRCYGRCFSGQITLIDGAETCTYFLAHGKIVSCYDGIPWDGYDVGVKGSESAWKSFATNDCKSLSRSTIWPIGESLELLGKPIRVRQSFYALAYLCKVYGDIIVESEVKD